MDEGYSLFDSNIFSALNLLALVAQYKYPTYYRAFLARVHR